MNDNQTTPSNNQDNTVPTNTEQSVIPVITQVGQNTKSTSGKEPLFTDTHTYRQFFKDAIKYITSKNSSELLSLLWRLLLVAGFVIILGVPFLLAKDLVHELLISFGINFDKNTLDMINLSLVIIYTIFAIYLLFKLCKERFYRYNRNKEEIQKLENQIKSE